MPERLRFLEESDTEDAAAGTVVSAGAVADVDAAGIVIDDRLGLHLLS